MPANAGTFTSARVIAIVAISALFIWQLLHEDYTTFGRDYDLRRQLYDFRFLEWNVNAHAAARAAREAFYCLAEKSAGMELFVVLQARRLVLGLAKTL